MNNQSESPDSYYLHSANVITTRRQLTESVDADVCVIGGGYTGLLTALNLAEKNYKVVLLEARKVGWGASGRNGGQVGSGHNKKINDLENDYGKDLATRLWDLAEDAKEIVRNRIEQHKIDCDLCYGNMAVSDDIRDQKKHQEYVDKLNHDYDYDLISYLSEQEVYDMFHSPFFKGGGSLDMGGMHLHPLNYALGLAEAAERAGVMIFEESEVIDYQGQEKKVVYTKKGQVNTSTIVLACNAYLEKLEKKIAGKIMPINNFMLATEPLDEDEARYINKDNVCAHDNKFHVHYFRMSQDNRLLFGGGENYTTKFPSNLKSYVRNTMLDVFPKLEKKKIDFAWGGTIAVTVNRMPHIGKLDSGVYFSHGFSGHGVAMASLAGTIMAEAIDGLSKRFDVFNEVKIHTYPGGTLLRWPGFYLGMLYFSLRDRL
jgi:gamma-glutamylputrescine oxidase